MLKWLGRVIQCLIPAAIGMLILCLVVIWPNEWHEKQYHRNQEVVAQQHKVTDNVTIEIGYKK
jgi:hypothetical protein